MHHQKQQHLGEEQRESLKIRNRERSSSSSSSSSWHANFFTVLLPLSFIFIGTLCFIQWKVLNMEGSASLSTMLYEVYPPLLPRNEGGGSGEGSNVAEDLDTVIRSEKWRIWTPDHKTIKGWMWDVKEIAFFSSIDCTGEILKEGRPIDSGNAGNTFRAGHAFDANTDAEWGGRADKDGNFWIGMEFASRKEVRCVSLLDKSDVGATALNVQAWESSAGTWENVATVRNYLSGHRQIIPISDRPPPPTYDRIEKEQEEVEYHREQTTRSSSRSPRHHHHPPLNIVLFYADDWTMKVLGKLNKYVQTPHIDAMADKGILYMNNYVTTSICWISRASLMTGVYAAVHQHHSPWGTFNMFHTNPWNQTLFPLLQQHGYHTGLVGKWHADMPHDKMKEAFHSQSVYYGKHWLDRNGQTRHVTDLNREDAISFLRERPKQKNFALKVSFFATHAIDGHFPSYEPQHESKETLYVNVTIPTPKTATQQHYDQLPRFFKGVNEGRTRWKKRFDPENYQDSIKDLYRMATEVDAAVGAVIAELKEQDVYDNTLLIFTTDNGNLHGEHGLAEKWYPFEESIRVPLVIQDPRMPASKKGTTCDDLTLSIDLTTTILGAANIPPSTFMQGRDIAHLYIRAANSTAAMETSQRWRKDFFYEFNRGDPVTAKGHEWKNFIDASFALVTKEWKYIYWPQHDYEQLFHRSLDPYDEIDVLNTAETANEIQTTDEIYIQMKERYKHLKKWVQSGKKV